MVRPAAQIWLIQAHGNSSSKQGCVSTTWLDRVGLTLVRVPSDPWLARRGFIVIKEVHDGAVITRHCACANGLALKPLRVDVRGSDGVREW